MLATVVVVSVRTRVPASAGRRSRTTRVVLAPFLLGMGVLFAILLGGVSPVDAGAERTNSLQSIVPANGASVQTPPTEIVLTFNQEVDDEDQLGVTLSCNSQPQQVAPATYDADSIVATVAVVTPLSRGSCIVGWVLRTSDGEILANQTTTFSILGDAPATQATTAPGATTTTDPEFVSVPATPTVTGDGETANAGSTGGALWLGRVLSTLGILVVFGGLALISVGWPEGPEYIVTVRFLRAAWVLGVVGTVLFVIAFAADSTGVSFGAAASPSAWLDLSNAGWEGRGALLRLVFVAGTGWVAMRPERIIDPASAMWAWGIPGFALVAVAMGRVAGSLPALGFLVNVVHVLAVAIWVGGGALVARVVLAGPGEEDLVHATRAFSRISIPAMLVAAVTGVIQVVRLDGGELFTSGHGRVLLLKVIVVAAMLAVSLAIRQQITERLDRAHEMTVQLADRFRRAFHAEAALGVVVLLFSGWLLQLTPPTVDPLADESFPLEIPFNNNPAGIDLRVFMGPGTAGSTGLLVEVDAPAEGINELRLQFVPPVGATGAFIVEQRIPLNGVGRAWLDDADGLPLNTPGTWTLKVFATTTLGVLDGAERTFSLTAEDGSFATVPAATTIPGQVEVQEVVPSTTAAPFATTTIAPPPTVAPITEPTTAPDG